MNQADERVLVLTYHSIATGSGPTSIDAATFLMQLDELAREGYRSLSVDEFVSWHRGALPAPGRRVLLTFDDGFADFAATAFPLLRERFRSALVFVPTRRLGGREDWPGVLGPPRQLLDWGAVHELAAAGVEFGGHGRTHADLTQLLAAERDDEIAGCGRELAERLGKSTRCFAAPYGRVDDASLATIASHYDAAFGTRFDRTGRHHPRHDLPRVEMHYFRDRRRWRGFLRGRLGYFHMRRALRLAGIVAHAVVARTRR
jgi:peptidoglycan/xylan/chitin deacetylase (PgdA/CDA1 family)